MTNEHNFKVGDRVRNLDYDLCGIITDFLGERFVKVKVIDDEVFSTWDINNLELYDRKTGFLQRLQSLLREYDASIGYFIGDDAKYGWCDYPFLIIGDEIVKYPAGDIDEITADNIMDFDKE